MDWIARKYRLRALWWGFFHPFATKEQHYSHAYELMKREKKERHER
jgi:hypothetical protein